MTVRPDVRQRFRDLLRRDDAAYAAHLDRLRPTRRPNGRAASRERIAELLRPRRARRRRPTIDMEALT